MKNKWPAILIIAFLFVFAITGAAQKNKSDLENLGLKGKVKRVEIQLASEGGAKKVYLFDEAGNFIDPVPPVLSYDERGRKTAAQYKSGKIVFNYDKAGSNTEQITYDNWGGIFLKYLKKYDDRENLLELTCQAPFKYGDRLITSYRFLFKYDNCNNLIEKQYFNADAATPTTKYQFGYNRKNQLTEETVFAYTRGEKLPRIHKYFYKYNKQGSRAEERYYEPVKESDTEDVKNKFEIINKKGTVKNGLLISDKPFMILWRITLCDYQYDAPGNWTTRTCKWKTRELEDFVPDKPDRQIITYY